MVKSEELTLTCPINTDQCEVPFPMSMSLLLTGCAASIGQLLQDQQSDILLFIFPPLISSLFFRFH